MSIVKVYDKEEFTFTWRIENFHMCAMNKGEYLVCPTFRVQSTKWYLKIYPKGEENDSIACYLYREKSDDGPVCIIMNFTLCLNSQEKNLKCHFYKGGKYGHSEFVQSSMEEYQENGFVIECHMIMITNETYSAEPFQALLNTHSPEISKEISLELRKKLRGVKRKFITSPKHCFARSRVSVERRGFTCPIKDFIYRGSDHKKHITVDSFTKAPPFLITLQMSKNDDMDRLEIEIRLLRMLNSNGVLACEIQMFDSGRKIYNFSGNNRLFTTVPENHVWKFGHQLNWSDLVRNEDAILYFQLAFSDGQIFSNIEWTSDVDYYSSFPTEEISPNDFSKKMFHLYSEKKFCDVTLQIKSEILRAHKCVLCAMSPVFDAMFQRGTKESATNIVHIEDLDPDTAKQMLDYMYTETIKLSKSCNAITLFSAADKYQIESLKSKCKDYLKNKLCVENICDVLSVADAHQDEELKEFAICFISIHKEEVLLSPRWKIFENENVRLTMESLKNAFLKSQY